MDTPSKSSSSPKVTVVEVLREENVPTVPDPDAAYVPFTLGPPPVSFQEPEEPVDDYTKRWARNALMVSVFFFGLAVGMGIVASYK